MSGDEPDPARVVDLFAMAQELPEAERETFLTRACAGDERLLHEVVSLLQAHATADRFLDAATLQDVEPAALDGRILERYEVRERLAVGGMGAVYAVRHRLLDQVRVLKVIRPELSHSAQLKKRFLREARIATRLEHGNIARIFDFDVDARGNAYLVMEYIPGWNLRRLVKSTGRLPVALAVEVARQALQALGYLHRMRLVHRDVSPDNLMLARAPDGRPLVKLIDLGIVKSLDPGHTLTSTGLFVGKVLYAAPEVFGPRGQEAADARSDLYALGIVLYELLTGVVPIEGSDYSSILSGHLMLPPRSFDDTDAAGHVPPALRRAVLSLLEKDPARRPQSAPEAEALLQAHAPGQADIAALAPGIWDRPFAAIPMKEEPSTTSGERALPGEPRPRHRTGMARARAWAYGGAALVLLAFAAALVRHGATRTAPPPARGATLAPVPAPPRGMLSLDARPWACVEVTRADAGVVATEEATPCLLALAPGTYLVRFVNDALGPPVTERVTVADGSTATATATFAAFDVDGVIRVVAHR